MRKARKAIASLNARIPMKPKQYFTEPKLETLRMGKLQRYVDDMIENSHYKSIANAVMNPGHGSNTRDALPFPDGDVGDVFLHKSVVTVDLIVPANAISKQVQVALVPFAECPMIIKVGDGGWQGIADTDYAMFGSSSILPVNYTHQAGVYESRLIGKSVTIDNNTAKINLAGELTACRMPSSIDNNSPAPSTGMTLTGGYNAKTLQNFPTNVQDISTNNNSTSWKASEGAYLVSRVNPNSWVKRDLPWNKASSNWYPITPAATVTANNDSGLYLTDLLGATKKICAGNTSNGRDGAYDGSNAETIGFPVNGFDGSDVVTAIFSGLSGGDYSSTFRCKLCIVREFKLKNTSALLRMVTQRPPCSNEFMQSLTNYANSIPGIYPADFNFWNELWNGFKRVVSKVSDVLPGITSVLAPVLPPQAQAAMAAANSANQIGRSVVDIFSKPHMVGGPGTYPMY